MSGLRVLITNKTLAVRGGAELYVRDLATGLLARGHTPIVYSAELGEVARELRAATITVIDNLSALGVAPDVIHGQDHVQMMEALLRFTTTPAVFFCHGWVAWEAAAPKFPRLLRYVAVDHTCRDRLVLEHAIPEDRIRVLFNFVDLERFRPRVPLPGRAQRALILSNYATEDGHIKSVREACERARLALDVAGLGAGNVCAEPEKLLGNYDIVFAKGRSALEAMAVGAAVVLCDATGVGPMVTTSELGRLRPLNFGIRALREPVSADVLAREIARYDANDAGCVAERIRATAGSNAVIEDILCLYREAIAEFKSAECDAEAEERAASEYLRWLAPRLRENERLHTEYDGLSSRFAAREQEFEAADARFVQQIAESELRATALATAVAAKEAELATITKTLGWRILSRYGPLKYRFVLPAYRRLQKLFLE